MADLAADAEDIKSRLANVPVYTVANKKNEFVLVSGEVRPNGDRPIDSNHVRDQAFAGRPLHVLILSCLPGRE